MKNSSILVTKIKIELEPDELRCFTRYQHNHNYDTLHEAIKAAAIRSLPKRKRWRKEPE